jgi:predicted nucleic acid-binding protein
VIQVVLLDSGPIGLITNPNRSSASANCTEWLQTISTAGVRVIIPEITDYEVRRELLRSNKVKGISRLDELIELVEYLPITTAAMRQAAIFWAHARQQGQPTAGDKTIDGDMILAAQAMTLNVSDVVIATTNVGHLSRFVRANLWQNITLNQ